MGENRTCALSGEVESEYVHNSALGEGNYRITSGFTSCCSSRFPNKVPDGEITPDDEGNPEPVRKNNQKHQSDGNIAGEVSERDRGCSDRLFDPVVLDERVFAADVAAHFPEHPPEHEHKTLPEPDE